MSKTSFAATSFLAFCFLFSFAFLWKQPNAMEKNTIKMKSIFCCKTFGLKNVFWEKNFMNKICILKKAFEKLCCFF